MKSAVVLAILGAVAALPAPQGPPPAVIPPPRESSNPQSFDNGQWSQWAQKTGGGHAGKTGGWHPSKTGGVHPTGTRPTHHRPTGTRPFNPPTDDDDVMSILPEDPIAPLLRRSLDIDYHLAPREVGDGSAQPFDDGQWSQWAPKTGGGHASKTGGWHPSKTGGWHASKTGGVRPTGTRPTHHRPTRTVDVNRPPRPTLVGGPPPPPPTGDFPVIGINPSPAASLLRRGLDIDYHLAPRDEEDKDNEDDDAAKEEKKQRKKQEKEEKKKQKEAEKEKEKNSTFQEGAPTGTATPTLPAGGRPHGTGAANPTGAFGTGSGFVRPTGQPSQPRPTNPVNEVEDEDEDADAETSTTQQAGVTRSVNWGADPEATKN